MKTTQVLAACLMTACLTFGAQVSYAARPVIDLKAIAEAKKQIAQLKEQVKTLKEQLGCN